MEKRSKVKCIEISTVNGIDHAFTNVELIGEMGFMTIFVKEGTEHSFNLDHIVSFRVEREDSE